MKNKIFAGLVLVLLIVACLVLLQLPFHEHEKTEEIDKFIPIRGCTVLHDNDFRDIAGMGCNYVQIVVWPQVQEDGEVIEFYDSLASPQDAKPAEELRKLSEKTENIIVNRIKKAHELGYKVYLVLYPERTGFHEAYGTGMKNPDKFLNSIEALALKWAKIAEENKVELFSPVNELFLWVGEEKANKWHEKILPKLREIYSGELVPRGLQFYQFDPLSQKAFEMKNTEFNFSGWDYVASDFYCGGIERVFSIENLRKCIIATLNKSIELKNKYNAKGIIYGEVSHPGGTSAEIFDLFFKENYGKVSGWFLWYLGDYSGEAKQVARRYFTQAHDVLNTSLEMPETLDIEMIASKIPKRTEVSFAETFDGGLEIRDKEGYEFDVPADNYTVLIKFRIIEGGPLIFFEQNSGSYEIQIVEASRIFFAKHNPNSEDALLLAETRREIRPNKSYTLEISRSGNNFAIYLDGKLLHAFSDPKPAEGKFVLTSYIKQGEIEKSHVVYEEIKVFREPELIPNEDIEIRGLDIQIHDREGISIAKSTGANWVGLMYFIEIDWDSGERVPDERLKNAGMEWLTRENVKARIREAKALGLKVLLQIYPEYWIEGKSPEFNTHAIELEHGPFPNQDEFLQEATEIVLDIARFAEEEKVDMFSPWCEMNIFVDWEHSKKWAQDILPKIREVYSGLVAPPKGEITWSKYKLENEGDLSYWNFSGYDYVWADVFDSDYHFNGLSGSCKSYDDYENYIETLLSILEELKERDNTKGIILGSEIGMAEQFLAEETKKGKDAKHVIEKLWAIIFNKTYGKVDGYFFYPWRGEQWLATGVSFEANFTGFIRRYYARASK